MTEFVVRRTATALIVLLGVLTLSFFALHLAPGDPSNLFLHPRMSDAQRVELERALGLDRPLLEQYGLWLRGVVLRGDLGSSFIHNRPVNQVVAAHIGPTLVLAAASLVVQFAGGLVIGVLAARKEGSKTDRSLRWLSLGLYSAPHFWLGLMALLVFSYTVGLFPAGHMRSVSAAELGPLARAADSLHHLVLPAATLGLAMAGGVALHIRNALIEVKHEDYIRSSRAAGVSERRILWFFGLKNALSPAVQLAGLSLPFLLSGALVTEVVFSWPGMGRLTFAAIEGRDYPLVLGCTLLAATLVVLGSLLADLAHMAIDPRVRKEMLERASG